MKTKLSRRINKYIDKNIKVTSEEIISSRGTKIVKYTIDYNGYGTLALGKKLVVYGVAQKKGALKTVRRLAKYYIVQYIKCNLINLRLKFI